MSVARHIDPRQAVFLDSARKSLLLKRDEKPVTLSILHKRPHNNNKDNTVEAPNDQIIASSFIMKHFHNNKNTVVKASLTQTDDDSNLSLRKNVVVACRVRPLSTLESSNPLVTNVISCLYKSVVVENHTTINNRVLGYPCRHLKPKQFPLDLAFHSHCTQEDIYNASCKHIVDGLFEGISSSILAYGATNSGKTYTIFGVELDAPGIIFHCIQDIMSRSNNNNNMKLNEKILRNCRNPDNNNNHEGNNAAMHKGRRNEGCVIEISCTFLEVYNEEVYDLWATEKNRRPLVVREVPSLSGGSENIDTKRRNSHMDEKEEGNSSGDVMVVNNTKFPVSYSCAFEGVEVKGLIHVRIRNLNDFLTLVDKALAQRATASTNFNTRSSRSHAVMSITVEVKDDESGLHGTVATLRICDLAGSERAAATAGPVDEKHRREGSHVNKSLLALGAVVQALAKVNRHPSSEASLNNRDVYIPYRSSKLTRLLKGCIGSNCRTSMIFCVSPSSLAFEETVNTLGFAMYAKMIQVNTKCNRYEVNTSSVVKNQDYLIEKLRGQVASLREELSRAQGKKIREKCEDNDDETQEENEEDDNDDSAFRTPEEGPLSSNDSEQSSKSLIQTTTTTTISNNSMKRKDKNKNRMNFSSSFLTSSQSLLLHSSYLSTEKEKKASNSQDARSFSELPHHLSVCGTRSTNSTTDTCIVIDKQYWSDLQDRLKEIVNKKVEIHRSIQEGSSAVSNIETCIRKARYDLVNYIAKVGPGAYNSLSTLPLSVLPVGIAGLREIINASLKKHFNVDGNMADFLKRQDAIDTKVRSIRSEILKEFNADGSSLVELLLDNANLRFTALNAEALATEYSLRNTDNENRLAEAKEALQRCILVISELMPLAKAQEEGRLNLLNDVSDLLPTKQHPNNGVLDRKRIRPYLLQRCRLALAYAVIPNAPTSKMIDAFQAVLGIHNNSLTEKLNHVDVNIYNNNNCNVNISHDPYNQDNNNGINEKKIHEYNIPDNNSNNNIIINNNSNANAEIFSGGALVHCPANLQRKYSNLHMNSEKNDVSSPISATATVKLFSSTVKGPDTKIKKNVSNVNINDNSKLITTKDIHKTSSFLLLHGVTSSPASIAPCPTEETIESSKITKPIAMDKPIKPAAEKSGTLKRGYSSSNVINDIEKVINKTSQAPIKGKFSCGIFNLAHPLPLLPAKRKTLKL